VTGQGVAGDETPDELRVVSELRIRVHGNGALSVLGPIDDARWCLEVLENARQAVLSHRSRRREIVVPERDVEVPARRSRS